MTNKIDFECLISLAIERDLFMYGINVIILGKKFVKCIRKYWPHIINRKINLDFCGIKTKSNSDDFIIQTYKNHGKLG
jgi:hypothetical protein